MTNSQAWDYAIGMIKVDGLEPTKEFKEYILPDTMEEFKLSADGPCEAPDAQGLREGYVYRSQNGEQSFKNVSREYLMKH